MISTLEMLEGQARTKCIKTNGTSIEFPISTFNVTSVDSVTVAYRPYSHPQFAYFHNGVRIERDRALELLPLEVEKEWPEFDGGDFGTYF